MFQILPLCKVRSLSLKHAISEISIKECEDTFVVAQLLFCLSSQFEEFFTDLVTFKERPSVIVQKPTARTVSYKRNLLLLSKPKYERNETPIRLPECLDLCCPFVLYQLNG